MITSAVAARHNRRALNEHAPELRDAEKHETVVDRREDHSAERGADDVPRAARDADAADDRRRKRRQLPAGGEHDGHSPHARSVEEASEAAKDAAENIGEKHDALRPEPEEGACRDVRPHGVHAPSQGIEAEERGQETDDDKCDHDQQRNAGEPRLREHIHPVRKAARCDLLPARIDVGQTAINGHGAERGDQRRDAPVGDKQPVQGPERRPDRERHQHEQGTGIRMAGCEIGGEIGRKPHDGAHRNVEVSGDEHHRLRRRHNRKNGRVGNDRAEVSGRDELRPKQRERQSEHKQKAGDAADPKPQGELAEALVRLIVRQRRALSEHARRPGRFGWRPSSRSPDRQRPRPFPRRARLRR